MIKWLNENPEKLHEPMPSSFETTMVKTFPCEDTK